MKDFVGHPLKIGDQVAFIDSQNRFLRIGRIQEVFKKSCKIKYTDDWEEKKIVNRSRSVVMKVIPVEVSLQIPKETLEVGELIMLLEDLIPYGVKQKYLNLPVKFDFGENVGELDSWRGVYSELTLNPANNYKPKLLGDFIVDLKASIRGKKFYGYKGGEYYMNIDTPVWADPSGTYAGRMITNVIDKKTHIELITEYGNVP